MWRAWNRPLGKLRCSALPARLYPAFLSSSWKYASLRVRLLSSCAHASGKIYSLHRKRRAQCCASAMHASMQEVPMMLDAAGSVPCQKQAGMHAVVPVTAADGLLSAKM